MMTMPIVASAYSAPSRDMIKLYTVSAFLTSRIALNSISSFNYTVVFTYDGAQIGRQYKVAKNELDRNNINYETKLVYMANRLHKKLTPT